MATAKSEFRLLERGIHSVAEATRLLQLSLQTTRRWAAEHDFTYPRAPRFSRSLIRPQLGRLHGLIELSFLELVELLFTNTFHERGVSLPVIRKAAKHACQMLRTSHPFHAQRFKTDGLTIFARLSQGKALPQKSLTAVDLMLIDLKTRQHEFGLIVTPFLQPLEYDLKADLVRQGWPLGKEGQIVVDPSMNFGVPMIANFGVATRVLKAAFRSHSRGDLLRRVVRLARVTFFE